MIGSRRRRMIGAGALAVIALLVTGNTESPPPRAPMEQDVPSFAGPDPMIAPAPEGLPDIPSNFDRATEIGADTSPINTANDVVGAFRFICQAGQLNWDDPIVYPGQSGASPHLHQWFGNSLGNADSTYRSLRTAGQSSCMGPLNRSAYWMPAMLDGRGHVIRPDYISIYYKRVPVTAPVCGKGGGNCRQIPRGLRYVFGFDVKRMGARQPEEHLVRWKCVTPQNTIRGGVELKFDQLDCPAGNMLMATLSSPDCWDGKRLDSADHRTHVVYQVNNPNDGRAYCPRSNPILLPQFSIGAVYAVGEGERIQDWYLSSDRMAGMPQMPSGSTFHADWYGAWDEPTLRTWTANCIDRLLSCSAGELGDGTIMRRPAGYGLTANPRLVPIPVHPVVAGVASQ
jgi:hypothetical protein